MTVDYEFLSPADKPALVAVTHPELRATSWGALSELGYKVHVADTHDEFILRFGQVQYQVVVLEECFAAPNAVENLSLETIQKMPMTLRRHAVFALLGHSFGTLNPIQAFQQSVNVVINPRDMVGLKEIILQTVSDNDLFLHLYRDSFWRVAQGKA